MWKRLTMGEEQQQNNVKSINIYEVNLDRN